MAKNAYSLLKEWGTPPGTQRDGTFKGEELISWLEQVKSSCMETGHLGVALSIVGQVLIYTPRDPDGLWLQHSVASVLNAKDAKDMRNGFRTELFNSRGVHSWTAGREERELAKKYYIQAEEVETYGYHRLASSLRELATSYENDADRQESRDPFDD